MSRRFEYAFSFEPREEPPDNLQTAQQRTTPFPVTHGRNTACEQEKKDWMQGMASRPAAGSHICL
jgi:hypothetical protein